MTRRDRNLFVEISARGDLKPSRQTAEHLAGHPGLWRIVPDVGRLLVIERIVDNRDLSRVRGKPREVALAGTFDSQNVLVNMLNFIHMSKLDGALHVGGQARKVLYFQRGVYLSGRSSSEDDRLGAVLARMGLLTAAQREQFVDEMGDGARLGAFLVGKGVLTTPKVYEGLRKQAESIFESILAMESGVFYLVQPLDMTEVPAMLRLDVQELLLDGLRRLDEAAERAQAQASHPSHASSQPSHGDAHDDQELRRSRPVSAHDLPMDGAVRIVDAYNDALRRLFVHVGPAHRANLLQELKRFIRESAPYAQLFEDVEIAADGALDGRILTNIAAISSGDPVTMMQVGLNELLFFVMFAAGDAIEPELEKKLQAEVAEALQKLPKPDETA